MCFSEKQSYLHCIVLFITSFYIRDKWQLALSLFFLGLKDLAQGLSYHYINDKKKLNILTSFSWIHICLQPFFVNLIYYYFDQDNYQYWNKIFLACILYAAISITMLNEFDYQNDPDCIKKNKADDFCSKETTSYIGKYHLGYKFSIDNRKTVFDRTLWYNILSFLPGLFSKTKYLSIGWASFVGLILNKYKDIGSGESGAIWCYLSVIFALPVALFSDNIDKMLN